MKPVDCPFEAEVLTAVMQSRWPEHVEGDLRAHAAGCAICSDVAAIAAEIEADREDLRATATLPESGRVWWLAQMRARREAAAAAGSPITAVQVIAFASAMVLLGACIGATSTWFQTVVRKGLEGPGRWKWQGILPSAAAVLAGHGVLVLSMAAAVVLIPAAVYFGMLRE